MKNRDETTLRELIATISDVAFEYAADTEEAYEIGCLVLVRILKDASLKKGTRRSAVNSFQRASDRLVQGLDAFAPRTTQTKPVATAE